MIENIYKGPGAFKTKPIINIPTPVNYTVAEQSIGFKIPESKLKDPVTVGLSGNGKVRDVENETVYRGGTTG